MDLFWHKKFRKSGIFVLGVSGGADSMALMHEFRQRDLQFVAAHFNHQLRSESDADAEFVKNKAKEAGVEFYLGTEDVASYALFHGKSIEEAARECRYTYLFSIAEEIGAQAVVVAHHANDQIETVLMHFLRGAGLDGLNGMTSVSVNPTFHKYIPIYRPLLQVWRGEIEDYCSENCIKFIVDKTNTDTKYFRNELRHEVLPLLEVRYPGFQSRLLKMANTVQADLPIIERQVEKAWLKVVESTTQDYLCFNKYEFNNLDLALKRRIIRKSLYKLNTEIRDVGYDLIDRAVKGVASKDHGEINLVNNYSLFLKQDQFFIVNTQHNWIQNLFPQLDRDERLPVNLRGETQISTCWFLSIEEMDPRNDYFSESNRMIYCDANEIGGQLYLRNKVDGDKIRLFGMDKGRQKVSDLFVNEKVLKLARMHWPLLVNTEDEIIWVLGLKMNDRFKITDHSKKVLCISLHQLT